MTNKELLYLEDVLEHIKDLRNISKYYLNDVEEEIKEVLEDVIEVAEKEYEKNCNLL